MSEKTGACMQRGPNAVAFRTPFHALYDPALGLDLNIRRRAARKQRHEQSSQRPHGRSERRSRHFTLLAERYDNRYPPVFPLRSCKTT